MRTRELLGPSRANHTSHLSPIVFWTVLSSLTNRAVPRLCWVSPCGVSSLPWHRLRGVSSAFILIVHGGHGWLTTALSQSAQRRHQALDTLNFAIPEWAIMFRVANWKKRGRCTPSAVSCELSRWSPSEAAEPWLCPEAWPQTRNAWGAFENGIHLWAPAFKHSCVLLRGAIWLHKEGPEDMGHHPLHPAGEASLVDEIFVGLLVYPGHSSIFKDSEPHMGEESSKGQTRIRVRRKD